jgi:hypothetical protein
MKLLSFSIRLAGRYFYLIARKRFVFLLLSALLTSHVCLFSQTTPLTFNQIPYDAPDIIAPGRGAEQWDFGSEKINNPTADTNIRPLDVYYRFAWTVLEGDSINSYDWTFFDDVMRQTIDNRQKLSFGIMPVYDGKGTVVYDGAKSAYPLYLHKLMQTGTWNTKDWISHGVWIPNWNSTHYLTRLRALHQALYNHIMSTSYKGVAFKDAIYCIDIRGYGNYGEWHNSGIVSSMSEYPIGRRAGVATLRTIIAHHTQVFHHWPLVLMIAAFDADQYESIMNPAELTYYALTTKNAWGPLGWRRDQWGATDAYLDNILKNNTKTYADSPPFKDWITTRYQTSPITGEPPNYVSPGGPCQYWDLERQLMDYGATSLGNGNFGVKQLSECGANNVRAAFKRAGYRIILEGGSITSNLVAGKQFSVNLKWKNIGIAPTYENWNIVFELKNENNVTVWTGMSKFKLKRFLPSGEVTSIDDTFLLPANIVVGRYKLNMTIKDPSGYRAPLPLAITGRNADGSYTIWDVTASPVSCVPPIAKFSNDPACLQKAYKLTLDSATGKGPFDLIINGKVYPDISVGQTIDTIAPPFQKIWDSNPAPNSYEDSPVELGVKFKSSVAGFIRGIRFFSSNSPSGTYTGHLWTSSGTLLNSATFTNVTAGGWQEVLFTNPVAIKADTVYVASYHTNKGMYAATPAGLSTSVENGYLSALASSIAGGNGLYAYDTAAKFPTNSFNAANYWVDVMFTPSVYTYNLTTITDSTGCSNSGNLGTVTVTLNTNCDTELPLPSLPGAVIGNTTACHGETFDLFLQSATGPGPYDLVINGTTYNNIEIGQTITSLTSQSQKIWDTIPAPNSYEDSPVELGVKFKSSTSGYIKGIRFFSPNAPSGVYTGHLWTSNGTLLDSAVFTGITVGGWQEVLFSEPKAIKADSIYVASYHTTTGNYAATAGGLLDEITNGSITVPASNAAAGNGVYSYGATPTFPSNSYNATNYWVDVIFTLDTASTYKFHLTSVTDSAGIVNNADTLQTLTVALAACSEAARPGNPPVTNKVVNSSSASISSISDSKSMVTEYMLGQNYPNPFSKETFVPYTIPVASHVTMSLYDMSGRLIRILVNGSREQGIHTVRLHSGSLKNGIYFYKIQAGNFSAVKKLFIQR